MIKNDIAVQIFTKANVPGLVKTRLIPDLGEQGASLIHQKLLDHVVNVAVQTFPDKVELWVSGDIAHESIRQLAQKFALRLFSQSGGNLGDKMYSALRVGLENSHRVLLVGADAYSIDSRYLQLAAAQLNQYDVVIGPAQDGGYILIGCNKVHANMFDHVAWGTENSLQDTLLSLQHCELRVGLLPARWDIDTLLDIECHAPQLLKR